MIPICSSSRTSVTETNSRLSPKAPKNNVSSWLASRESILLPISDGRFGTTLALRDALQTLHHCSTTVSDVEMNANSLSADRALATDVVESFIVMCEYLREVENAWSESTRACTTLTTLPEGLKVVQGEPASAVAPRKNPALQASPVIRRQKLKCRIAAMLTTGTV